MGTPTHQAAIYADHATDAPWRAVAEALAGELAAVWDRLAHVERLLGLPAPPDVRGRCHQRLGCPERGASRPNDAPSPLLMPPSCPATDLSRREAEVLGLLAAGRSNRDIAQRLFLSPRTVQRHVANAYVKIGAHCRAEATAFAIDHGLR